MKIPVFDLNYGEEELRAVVETLHSKWISTGPKCEALETQFAEMIGVPHAVSLSSCTAGLHLALRTLKVGPGDQVIVPSLTFVATASAVLMVGAEPVFADVESLDTWTISPEDVAAKITPRTKAIIAMHYGGYGANMEGIVELAREHSLWVIEDACHAPLGTRGGRMLGTFGDVACYSFYSNKNISTAEGGMLVTSNEDLAGRVRLLRSHGMTSTAYERKEGVEFYDVVDYGYNYRLDDIRAALGLVQLERLRADIAKRTQLVARYRQNLSSIDDVTIPFADYDGRPSHYILPILLPVGVNRKDIRVRLADAGIGTTMHYPPVHLFSCYESHRQSLDVTEQIARRELSLPLFFAMSESQVEFVCATIAKVMSS